MSDFGQIIPLCMMIQHVGRDGPAGIAYTGCWKPAEAALSLPLIQPRNRSNIRFIKFVLLLNQNDNM